MPLGCSGEWQATVAGGLHQGSRPGAPALPWRLILLILSLPAFVGAGKTKKPKEIDLQELGSATTVITFRGAIALEGETRSLVYVQPIPAEDDNQKIVEVTAKGGGKGVGPENFSYDIQEEGAGRKIALTWENIDTDRITYEIAVKIHRESFNLPIASTHRGKDDEMLGSGALTAPSAEIKKKSAEVVKGSGSDLEAALRLAAWINQNVEYDLNYSQDKKDKPAAVVIKKKRGTCDEISHLFISMARSAGIPAREVSGVAFNGEVWGFHSWSELKFEDRWVAFDATNMQAGFVDATHLAFARDYDDAKFEQKIVRLGVGAFKVESHTMEVRIWKASRLKKMLEVDFKAAPKEVPPGWNVELTVDISNVSSSIVAGPVRVILPPEFTPKEAAQKTFLLAPGGKTTIRWTVATGGPAEPEAAYFYKLGAITFPRVVAEAELTVATRMIEGINAAKDDDGTVSVEIGFKNLFEDKKPFSAEACFYSSWQMDKKIGCVSASGEAAPSAVTNVVIDSPYSPTGNFAVEIMLLCGGLSERSIMNVDTGGK
jgi:hypothetical protein